MCAFGKSTGGGRRDAKRESAPLGVVLTTLSTTYKGQLVDISSTGARIRGRDLPAVGDELVVGVERVRAFGVVRWQCDGDCGVQFDEPLLQHDVLSLRREVAKAAGLPPELKGALDDWVLGLAR